MYTESTIIHKSPALAEWTNDKEKNPYITETAGFVPLEIKFRQFEQNGLRMQFSENEFDSSDYREMFSNPNAIVYPGDDLETITEKLLLQDTIKNEILARKLAETKERSDEVQASPSVIKKEVDDVKGDS